VTRAAVVVLAAGGSSRMGRPKQLLPVGGRTLLRRVAELAVECGPTVIVLGAAAGRLTTELDGLPVTVAENPDWDRGPGTSVAAGVKAVDESADAVVFLLCDQPAVTADHVRRLIAAHETTGRPMAASGYGGSVGVPALFARELFPALRTLDPAAGAKQLLARNPERVAVIPFPNGAIDLDTPVDYERWLAAAPASSKEESHAPGQ
jgi:molybdenum cofactor cytidylyltransferase